MQLTDDQKREVAAWISGGAKLSEVQQRLADTFGIRLTYMEARLLVDDLSLVPQETKEPEAKPDDASADAPQGAEEAGELASDAPGATPGRVCVEVDNIMRPGALVSGRVTFSDGVTADWSLDRMGRFGMLPSQEGYKPTKEDLAEFRKGLEEILARQGY